MTPPTANGASVVNITHVSAGNGGTPTTAPMPCSLRLSLAVCGSRTSGGSGQSISSDPSTVLLSDTLRRHGHELVGVARHSIGVKDSLPSSAALAACVSRSHLPRHNFSARSREKDCAQNNRRA